MKIAQTALQLHSEASYQLRTQREQRLQLAFRQTQAEAAPSRSPTPANIPSSTAPPRSGESDEQALAPNMRFLLHLIETLTGEKVRLFQAPSHDAPPPSEAPPPSPSAANETAREWSVRIDTRSVREETQHTQFSAQGLISTSEGQQIHFSLSFSLSRSTRTESSTQLIAGTAPRAKDPLVLNFSQLSASLNGARIAFDLDSDGQTESLPVLAGDSAYLAWDKNANAQVDEGSELFGPRSNDGFLELSRLDDDDNGWIDENDAAFTQLRLWQPGHALRSLAAADVGAIALANQGSPFALSAQGDQLRSSGVFLSESGQAHSIQQIDVSA